MLKRSLLNWRAQFSIIMKISQVDEIYQPVKYLVSLQIGSVTMSLLLKVEVYPS